MGYVGLFDSECPEKKKNKQKKTAYAFTHIPVKLKKMKNRMLVYIRHLDLMY